MSIDKNNPLSFERLKISERLESLEKDGEATRLLLRKIYGDPDVNPPILGYEARLRKLEIVENDREQAKKNLIKMAVGSITIALGGAIIWVFDVVRAAFITKVH